MAAQGQKKPPEKAQTRLCPLQPASLALPGRSSLHRHWISLSKQAGPLQALLSREEKRDPSGVNFPFSIPLQSAARAGASCKKEGDLEQLGRVGTLCPALETAVGGRVPILRNEPG